MIRRLVLVLVLGLGGCVLGPRELHHWLVWHNQEPRRAVAWLCHNWPTECRPPTPPPTTRLAGMSSCSQWADEAWAAGWRTEGYDLGRVMWAESRCNPGAYNPQSHWGGHATGLMQIIDPTWPNAAAACRGGLYDPVVNLRCALYIRRTQGWDAWVTF